MKSNLDFHQSIIYWSAILSMKCRVSKRSVSSFNPKELVYTWHFIEKSKAISLCTAVCLRELMKYDDSFVSCVTNAIFQIVPFRSGDCSQQLCALLVSFFSRNRVCAWPFVQAKHALNEATRPTGQHCYVNVPFVHASVSQPCQVAGARRLKKTGRICRRTGSSK